MMKNIAKQPINILDKLNLLSDYWSPRVIAEMNDYQFKIVKVKGDFIWHQHAETDETFVVIEGEVRLDFRNGSISLKEGEMFVIPKGIEHKPFAKSEAKLMLIEPRGVLNTGDLAKNAITAENDVWI